jgi:hypothetical protein
MVDTSGHPTFAVFARHRNPATVDGRPGLKLMAVVAAPEDSETCLRIAEALVTAGYEKDDTLQRHPVLRTAGNAAAAIHQVETELNTATLTTYEEANLLAFVPRRPATPQTSPA